MDPFVNSNISDEDLLQYGAILQKEKIVNIPNFISENAVQKVNTELEVYPWWFYSVKTSVSELMQFDNLKDPALYGHFAQCQKDLENKRFAYRFKKGVFSGHYAECWCTVCSVTRILKGQPFLEKLSKVAGSESLIPQEIFFSKYTENDFLNVHHDKTKGDIAVTVSFTREWDATHGGILHFVDNNTIYKSIVPHAGDMNIFLLDKEKGLDHFVSSVVVNKSRYMVSAWYSVKI